MSLLPLRTLGRTGLRVSWPALGGAGIGATEEFNSYGAVTDADAIDALRTAHECGINFIDTSPLYGESERRIGLAFKELGLGSDFVVQTKCGTHPDPEIGGYGYDQILRSVENSLNNLGHVDVLLLHDPTFEELNEAKKSGGALDAMLEAQRQGMVKYIGIGVREHECLLGMMDTGLCDVILTYLDYNLMNRSAAEKVLPEAQRQNIGVVNGSVFYNGLISGADPFQKVKEGNRPPTLSRGEAVHFAASMREWCIKHGGSGDILGSLALGFGLIDNDPLLKNGTIVVGSRNSEEVRGICKMIEGLNDLGDLMHSFREEFDAKVDTFDAHFYYDKTQGAAG